MQQLSGRKGNSVMRKIILGLIITGFALVTFILVRPFTSNLTLNPEPPQSGALKK